MNKKITKAKLENLLMGKSKGQLLYLMSIMITKDKLIEHFLFCESADKLEKQLKKHFGWDFKIE